MSELNIDGLKIEVKKNLEPFFREIIAKQKSELVAIYVTGSALTDDYLPDKSDLNSLLVVKDVSLELLDYLILLGKKYSKKMISPPLLMTPSYIARSLDVFPIEFLELKTIHQLVYGEEELVNLEIDKHNLRLQIERELKGILVNLRQSYLRSGNDKNILQELLLTAFTSFIPIFRSLLFIKSEALLQNKLEVLEKTEKIYALDVTSLKQILEIKKSGRSLKIEHFKEIFLATYKCLGELVEKVDALEI